MSLATQRRKPHHREQPDTLVPSGQRLPLLPTQLVVPTLLVGIRCDKAGIDGKSFRAHQHSREASLHHRFEDVLQDIALPKPAVAILREACVIRHLAAQSEAAEPAIGEVEMDLLASWYSERTPIE